MNNLAIYVLTFIILGAVALVYYAWFFLPSEMTKLYREGVRAFSKAMEQRSNLLYGSAERSVSIALAVGIQLGLTKKDLTRLEFAAYLRDIGFSAVPYNLINNPSNRSQAEEIEFDRHAETGAAMLEQIAYLKNLAPIVRFHHAPWFGDGNFPGVSGARLPLESRILALVSHYCEIEAREGHDQAMRAVSKGTGTRFDPRISEAFELIMEGPSENTKLELVNSDASFSA